MFCKGIAHKNHYRSFPYIAPGAIFGSAALFSHLMPSSDSPLIGAWWRHRFDPYWSPRTLVGVMGAPWLIPWEGPKTGGSGIGIPISQTSPIRIKLEKRWNTYNYAQVLYYYINYLYGVEGLLSMDRMLSSGVPADRSPGQKRWGSGTYLLNLLPRTQPQGAGLGYKCCNVLSLYCCPNECRCVVACIIANISFQNCKFLRFPDWVRLCEKR